MIPIIDRQADWVRASIGLYPHPKPFVHSFTSKGWQGYRDRSISEKEVEGILELLSSRDSALILCHESGYRLTYRLTKSVGNIGLLYLKHYQCRNLSRFALRSYFRYGHARKSFRLNYLINKNEKQTPRVLFFLVENGRGFGSDRLIATEALVGSFDLRSWVMKCYPLLEHSEKKEFICELAKFVSRLLSNKILHGDLESNIMIYPKPFRFYIIDLDSIRIYGSILKRDRERQLTMFMKKLPEISNDNEISILFRQVYEKLIKVS